MSEHESCCARVAHLLAEIQRLQQNIAELIAEQAEAWEAGYDAAMNGVETDKNPWRTK